MPMNTIFGQLKNVQNQLSTEELWLKQSVRLFGFLVSVNTFRVQKIKVSSMLQV